MISSPLQGRTYHTFDIWDFLFKFSGYKKQWYVLLPSGEDKGSFHFFKRTDILSAGRENISPFFKFLPAFVNFHRVSRTKIEVNKIWNTHFTGSPLWDLFSEGAQKVESSYNRSIKYMMNLPFATHRCLIEPLSCERHIKIVLIKRFVSFMEKNDKSSKSALNMLKSEALKDVRSVTGTNFKGMCFLWERWT